MLQAKTGKRCRPSSRLLRPQGRMGRNAPLCPPFFLDFLFIQGSLETSLISDDEPIMLGEEPPARCAMTVKHAPKCVTTPRS
jgi:hypothetical protein